MREIRCSASSRTISEIRLEPSSWQLRFCGGARAKRDAGLAARSDRIERAANRMNRMIQDLLDVTRMEAGSLAIEAARVSARQVVSEVVESARGRSPRPLLSSYSSIEQDLPAVWADRDRLLQVFENLIGNAVKFTEPRGRIVVGAAARGKEVLFWVQDTGLRNRRRGSAARLRSLLAGGGRRGAVAPVSDYPIVKGIVEAHGGRIWVESAQGHGSTFFFTIPTAALTEKKPGKYFGSNYAPTVRDNEDAGRLDRLRSSVQLNMPMVTAYPPTAPARAELDRSQGPVLVEFGAAWCGICQALQPAIAEALASTPRCNT